MDTTLHRNNIKLGEGTYGVVTAVEITNKNNVTFQGAKKEVFFEESISGFGIIREVELIEKLSKSPFIPKLLKVFIDDYEYRSLKDDSKKKDFISFVCERSSCNLSNFIKTNRYSFDTAVKLSSDLLMGIVHIHRHNIIHRDIKPSNMLIFEKQGTYTLKICDFGFSYVLSDNSPRGYNVNTSWYRAPEIFWEFCDYSLSSDIWGVGSSIYELFTGKALLKELDKREDPYEAFRIVINSLPFEIDSNLIDLYKRKASPKIPFPDNPVEFFKINPIDIRERKFYDDITRRFKDEKILPVKKLILSALNMNYEKRYHSKMLLDMDVFKPISGYIEKYLNLQYKKTALECINIDIDEETNAKKVEFFEEAYELLYRKVSMRVFFHAVDLANTFLTIYKETSFDRNMIFSSCLYFFEKYFSILNTPRNVSYFFFKTNTREEIESDEEVHRKIDEFVFDFERSLFKHIYPNYYRHTLYEMQDALKINKRERLSRSQMKDILFSFLRINKWDKNSYRVMFKQLCLELFNRKF